MQAPTNKPPLEPPLIAKYCEDVILSFIKNSAAAIKSSNTFCLFNLVPALCHLSPYSPPPLMLGTAYTPPFSINTEFEILKYGVRLTLKPPYPYNIVGLLPFN